MTIESFGYEVMSLDELIEALTARRESCPELGGKPVWIANLPPLVWPVRSVDVGDGHGVRLYVEKGGN